MDTLHLIAVFTHPLFMAVFMPSFLFALAVGGLLINRKRERINARLRAIRTEDQRARRGFQHKEK